MKDRQQAYSWFSGKEHQRIIRQVLSDHAIPVPVFTRDSLVTALNGLFSLGYGVDLDTAPEDVQECVQILVATLDYFEDVGPLSAWRSQVPDDGYGSLLDSYTEDEVRPLLTVHNQLGLNPPLPPEAVGMLESRSGIGTERPGLVLPSKALRLQPKGSSHV